MTGSFSLHQVMWFFLMMKIFILTLFCLSSCNGLHKGSGTLIAITVEGFNTVIHVVLGSLSPNKFPFFLVIWTFVVELTAISVLEKRKKIHWGVLLQCWDRCVGLQYAQLVGGDMSSCNPLLPGAVSNEFTFYLMVTVFGQSSGCWSDHMSMRVSVFLVPWVIWSGAFGHHGAYKCFMIHAS